MSALVGRLPARQGLGVLLALLAAAYLAPPAARASCGDYVVLGDRGVRAAESPRPAPPARHAPCSGPLCSRHPLHLPLTPPPTAPQRGDSWASLDLLPLPAADGPPDGVPPEVEQRPVRHARTVYHPPR